MLVLAFCGVPLSAQYTVKTIAGTGVNGLSGDGGPATSAAIANPGAIAVDGAGNLYFGDTTNNRVRKVDATGIITTIAGTGSSIDSGDGGPALSAGLNQPYGIALDSGGSLYISTAGNRIRKITNGVITTVAGNGVEGFSGDTGPATRAQLSRPFGLSVDASSNLYIADSGNRRIRKVSNGVITTIAGGGSSLGDGGPGTSAQLNFPTDVTVSGVEVYIADLSDQRIRKLDVNGVITTIAGAGLAGFIGDGGPATSAHLDNPSGIVLDSARNIYIADSGNNRVRRVVNGVINTIAGTGVAGFRDGAAATVAEFDDPEQLFLDNAGNIFVADHFNSRIRVITPTAECTPVRLLPVVTSLSNGGAVAQGFPVAITVNVVDDCGSTLVSGSVVVTFSDGDPPIALTSDQHGLWSGTWVPRNVSSQVLLTVRASSATSLTGTVVVTLTITTSSPPPAIGAVTDGASFQVDKPFSPGSFITIFGTNLANNTAQATSLPLPTTLAGASVLVGSLSAPLYYVSSGQINAILPHSLPLNTTAQVLTIKGALLSVPTPIAIAAANPGIFTYGQNQGTITNADSSLSSAANPSARGATIIIYCEGLGAVSPAVADGFPPSGLSRTVNAVGVTIGGATAFVSFAGLAPGFVGLYQVNAIVPNDAPVGNQVQVVISAAGQSSVPVTMAVR